MVPLRVDPAGVTGPTPGRARGPHFRRTTPGRCVPVAVTAWPQQRVLEQAQRLPAGGAVGGWASLLMNGAAYFDGVGRPVPLVLPPGRTLHPSPEVQAVRVVRAPEVVVRHGVPCLEPHAALLWELARASDDVAALVAADMALAAGVVDLARLQALDWADLPRRGRARVARAARLADDRSLSPRETWLRNVWTEVAGLPRPRCNWVVRGPDDQPVASPDLLDPEAGVAADYDGAAHRSAARHRRDERRREAMARLDLEHVVVVGQGPGDEDEVAARLAAAYARAERHHDLRLWSAEPGRLPSW